MNKKSKWRGIVYSLEVCFKEYELVMILQPQNYNLTTQGPRELINFSLLEHGSEMIKNL